MINKEHKEALLKDIETLDAEINNMLITLKGALGQDDRYSTRNQIMEFMRMKHDILSKIYAQNERVRRRLSRTRG